MIKETKEERFKRVVEKRVNRVLENLRILSNCSNTRMYSWNDTQLKKIWSVIDKELKQTKERFNSVKPKKFEL